MVGVLIKTNMQSKIMNTLTIILYRRVSPRELASLEFLKVFKYLELEGLKKLLLLLIFSYYN